MESNKRWESAKAAAAAVSSSSKAVIVVFFLLLVGGAIFMTRGIDTSSFTFSRTALYNAIFSSQNQTQPHNPTVVLYHLRCPLNLTKTPAACSKPPPTTSPPPITPPAAATTTCPSYFRWIHEDLRPWASAGISRATLERAKPEAAFRLAVVNGRAYLEKYHGVFQTRDAFTLWGILQLLNRYPGRVPDFELMFNCEDMPVVPAKDYQGGKAPPPPPPPLFRYCKDDATVDIVFPDWSFWGWPEINIKPWVTLIKELEKGNKRMKWKDRDPHAYWKGNPWVASTRQDLMKCNVNRDRDFNARLYAQDWGKEIQKGFKTSDLASQCTHRFKIYIEGRAWSVSEKYILACDSPTLFVATRFRDFFNRGLMPGHHYVPIRNDDKCGSIKNAVDWGNTHQDQAQAIGKAGSGFIQKELKIDYVYDYMFHLLSEYSKLLDFKPSVPENAVELCLESVACQAQGKVKAYMIESMVKAPSDTDPCIMPPPFGMNELRELLERKANATAQVRKWG